MVCSDCDEMYDKLQKVKIWCRGYKILRNDLTKIPEKNMRHILDGILEVVEE